MEMIRLRAHYDGRYIQLDEPFDLQPNARLIVTVLSVEQPESERDDWLLLSRKGLEKAYSEEEAEYPLYLIKEANPDYEGR